MAKKLHGWQGKLLSGAGKDILIRVVAQALPTHAMNCFLLTKNFCQDLQQMCARFWWGSSTDKKKIHWRSWEKLCLPKERGGLGFRDLHAFNLALLAKQAWRITEKPDSLITQLFKARYFPQTSFWDATESQFASFSWRNILVSRELLLKGMRWRVGSGLEISAWSDPWLPTSYPFLPVNNPPAELSSSVVSDFISPSRCWDKQKVLTSFEASDAAIILAMPLSERSSPGRRVWSPETKGHFTVKSAYFLAMDAQFTHNLVNDPMSIAQYVPLWKEVWHAHIPASAKVCVWKAGTNILPTADRLLSKQVLLDNPVCCLCEAAPETILHLASHCPYSKEIFGTISDIDLCYPAGINFSSFLE